MTRINRYRARGRIEVKTYEPTPYEEPSGAPSLSLIKVTETFVGDIQGEGSVSFIQAALGGEIEVPTLQGKATVKIPAGFSHGGSHRPSR